MEVSRTRRPRVSLSRAVGGALVLAAALLVLWLQAPGGTTLLARAGILSSPRPFLELSFSDPAGHPTDVTPGQPIPVSFVMSANDGTFSDVAWRIETIDASGSRLVASGNETVPEGESRTVARDVPVACAGATSAQPRTQVRVSVAQPELEIHFWVACAPGGP